MHGVDGVVHLASPVLMSKVDEKGFLEPAIASTVGILKSVQKYGCGFAILFTMASYSLALDPMLSVSLLLLQEARWATLVLFPRAKNISSSQMWVTSSFAGHLAHLNFQAHWSDDVVERVQAPGAASSQGELYMASKVLAEKAALDFMEEEKSNISFDLAVVLPVLVSIILFPRQRL